jgi:hypothetical protein
MNTTQLSLPALRTQAIGCLQKRFRILENVNAVINYFQLFAYDQRERGSFCYMKNISVQWKMFNI